MEEEDDEALEEEVEEEDDEAWEEERDTPGDGEAGAGAWGGDGGGDHGHDISWGEEGEVGAAGVLQSNNHSHHSQMEIEPLSSQSG